MNDTDKPLVLLLIASVREGRAGKPVGDWFESVVRMDGRFDVDVADLATMDLPMMSEPNHPRLGQYTQDVTKTWSARVDRADIVVLVHPEYNFSYPAPLKNALDYLVNEWANKPVGFVSYGGLSGGTRAIAALQPVMHALRLVPSPVAVNLVGIGTLVHDGRLEPTEAAAKAAPAMLDDLVRLHEVLAPLRRSGAEEDTDGTA